jgi:hypothetical protein
MAERFDAIIIGAGAAGLYCALHAGRRGRRVLLLERNSEPGAKILISGGGRCNFTNIHTAPDRFISANPHFARSALARHAPSDFIALIEKHAIPYYEKTLGQLFCEGRGAARRVVAMLMAECANASVDVRLSCEISTVSKTEFFSVETNLGVFEAPALVLASGGLSIPKLGASDFAFRIAEQFSIPIVAPRPGLVPLTFGEADLAWMRPLSGVSTDIIAQCGKARFREAALFTHRGLSGPAILQISSYWREGEPVLIDWLPDSNEDALVQRKRGRPKAQFKSVLAELLPDRLASALSWTAGISPAAPEATIGDLKDQALTDSMRRIKHFPLTPIGTEGYAKAEVTLGGIDTAALSQKTMACNAAPGLYFIGECVDVTGWLGGYNFQWAWSSAWAAAQAL